MPPHLLVESVEQLLPRRCTRKRRAVIQRPAESPVVQQSFRRAVEHHAHAVQQVDDSRRGFAHPFDQRLVRQKIAAVNRVIEVFIDGVALALLVLRGVNAALRGAQTECDRFTGTMEKSSTGMPASATRMVAIRPASPPPTTMIFGCLIFLVSRRRTDANQIGS